MSAVTGAAAAPVAQDDAEGGAEEPEPLSIEDLPEVALVEVLSHLPASDLLGSVPLVCRRFLATSRSPSVWRRVDLVLDDAGQRGAGLRRVVRVLQRAPALRLLDLHMLPSCPLGGPGGVVGEDLYTLTDALRAGVSDMSHLHMCRADVLLGVERSHRRAWRAYLNLLRRYRRRLVWLRLMDCGPAGVPAHTKEADLLAELSGMPRLTCLEYDYFAAGKRTGCELDFSACESLRRFRWVDGEVLVRPAAKQSPGQDDEEDDEAEGGSHCRTWTEHRHGLQGPTLCRRLLLHLGAHLTEFGFVPNCSQPDLPVDVRDLLAGCSQLRDLTLPVGEVAVIRDMRHLRSLKLVGDVGWRLRPKRARQMTQFLSTAADNCFQTLTSLSLEFNGLRVNSRCRHTRQFIMSLCARCVNVRFLHLKGSTWQWGLLENVFRVLTKVEALYLCFVHFELDRLERFALFLPKLKYLTINSWHFSPYEDYSQGELQSPENTECRPREVDHLRELRPEVSCLMLYKFKSSSVRAMHCGETRNDESNSD